MNEPVSAGGFSARLSSFRVNGVLVEPADLRLVGEKAIARVEPKVMALLVALAERPGQLWTRAELLEQLWTAKPGSDEALTRIVYLLRKALKKAAAPDCIITVPTLGYRLEAQVESLADTMGQTSPGVLPIRPFSVAVLPVVDHSENSTHHFLATGLTRDLTTLLSRTPRFQVAPYSSACRFSSESPVLRVISQSLRVRYVVTAALACLGETVRIRVELSDAVDEALLWAEKYETHVDRFFEIQDEMVCNISTAISAKVNVEQPRQVERSGRFNLSAYERVQAAEALRLNYGRESAMKIASVLQEALEIEPDNPVVRAALAVQLSQNVVSQWMADAAATRSQANTLIAEALRAAPQDPDVLTAAGIVNTMFHQPDQAIHYLEMSVARNPNDAHALAVLGWQRCLRHADADGISLIETAETRAPHHPRFGLWATYRATGQLFLLNYEAALPAADDAVARTPAYYQPHLTRAWALAGLGDCATALAEIEMARELESADILEKFVKEMRKWAANSPNRRLCWSVLDKLLQKDVGSE